MTSPTRPPPCSFPGRAATPWAWKSPTATTRCCSAGSSCSASIRSSASPRARARSSPRCFSARWRSGPPATATTPLAAAGHSLGEYAALTAAGAIDFEDAVRLVGARAQAMADAAARQPGGMVAMLGGERDDVYELAAELGLSLANDNAPGQIVLSGAMERRRRGRRSAPTTSAAARASSTSAAPFTRRSWRPPPSALQAALDATPIREPAFPVLSNGSTQPVRGHPRASSPRTSSSPCAGARSCSRCRRWARRTSSSAAPAPSCAASSSAPCGRRA